MDQQADHYARFFSLSLDLLCIAGSDGYFKELNPYWERTLGFTLKELLEKPFIDFIHPDDRQKTADQYAAQAGGFAAISFENRYLCKDGSYKWLLWHATPLLEDGLIFAVAKDITQRKQLEEEVRIASDENPNPNLRVDKDGAIRYANHAAVRLLLDPWRSAVGDRAPAEVLTVVSDGLAAGAVSEFEITVDKHTFVLVLAPVTVRGYVNLYGRDVSKRKNVEAQLRQAQKMESVGRLAGGVAHDFNNLLTAIGGYSHFLLTAMSPNDPRRSDVEEIKKAGERAAALTRQLLAFSRQQVLQPRLINLNTLVQELEKMLRRLIGEDVVLTTKLQDGLESVKADPGQIEQVILNLAVNARDAMPTGGTLTIETRGVRLSEDYAQSHPDVSPGPHVMLAVSDTGCGMDAVVQARLFEPFFTTKEQGKGTGLGLATVHGIVRQSGGSIFVYSEPGHGSVFKVYLPVAASEAQAPTLKPEPPKPSRGAETVLLTEDDDAVRKFVSRLLREFGYAVLEAATPKEALDLSQARREPIDLLISDLVMPQMRGEELASKLCLAWPALKVIFISGYTEAGVVRGDMLKSGASFVHKPINPELLLGEVRAILDRGERPAA